MLTAISLLVSIMLTSTSGSYYALPLDDCEVWESDMNQVYVVDASDDTIEYYSEILDNLDNLDGYTGVAEVCGLEFDKLMSVTVDESLETGTFATFGFVTVASGDDAVAVLAIDHEFYPLFTYVDDETDGTIILFPYEMVEMIQNNGEGTLIIFVTPLY